MNTSDFLLQPIPSFVYFALCADCSHLNILYNAPCFVSIVNTAYIALLVYYQCLFKFKNITVFLVTLLTHFTTGFSICTSRNYRLFFPQMECDEKEMRREISYAIKNIHGIR